MEKSVKPDKKYYTKSVLIFLTITILAILAGFIIQLSITLAHGNPQAINIVWISCAGSVLLMWIIAYPITWLWIKNLHYTFFDDRVTINKGILTKTQQNIPLRSVTDFALQRTIYDRLLGIGSIKIQTAGQSHTQTGYEGSLSGLLDFENLHNQLRERIKVLHPVSESLATAEPTVQSEQAVLKQILTELKVIRRVVEKR